MSLTAAGGLFVGASGTGCAASARRRQETGETARTVRIVFFTDVHATTGRGAPAAVALAARAVNDVGADLILGGGDLIHGGLHVTAAETAPLWDVYMSFHESLDGRIETAIGNHDLTRATGPAGAASARDEFQRHFGLARTYRSIDACGRRVLLLDSLRIVAGSPEYEGRVDEKQLDWIRSELARTDPETPIVLVSHIPLLTVYPAATGGWGETAPASRVVANADEVLALFEGHRLELVLQGHLHVFEQIVWRGTTFVTGGAICGNWWKGTRSGTPAGFCVIDLYDDRRPEVSYRDYGWTVPADRGAQARGLRRSS